MHLLHRLLLSACCAVLSHVWCHRRPPATIPAFIVVLFLPPLAITGSNSIITSYTQSLVLYLGLLGASIAAYRLSPYHPLARYPGPCLAKITRLWATLQAVRGQQYLVSHSLFERYGDVVRTGPDHLIIRSKSAIPTILGHKSLFVKHARYEVAKPKGSAGSLLGIVDPAAHKDRRRIWERAFTPAALREYESPLQSRVSQLQMALSGRSGQPVDLAQWISFMTLDFMGDFGYGGAFNLMASGEDTLGYHGFASQVLARGEALGTIPWVRPFVLALPKLEAQTWRNFAYRTVINRVEQGSNIRDIFYYLLNEDGEGSESDAMSMQTLANEASLVMIAGAETTGAALSNALFYLITHPQCMTRLRAELDQAAGNDPSIDGSDSLDLSKLSELKYLQAVINETLRLMPAVPNGVQRTYPQENDPVLVAGYVIPGGTSVQVPTWSLQRDPRYFFPNSDDFWPARWLPEGQEAARGRGEEFRLDQSVQMTFSYGPTNCVGRSLALLKIRAVLAMMVRRFDIELAPDFQAADWLAQIRDQYALAHGKLMVVLRNRV